MEPLGLFLGTTQAVAQLAGVVKRHVSSYKTLYSRASSIEARALDASHAACQLSALAEVPGISLYLSQKLEELKDVESKLSAIDLRMSNSSFAGTFFRAPVLLRELNEIDSDLKQLDFFFRMIGILSTFISSQRMEMHELAFTMVSACLSVSGNSEQQRQVLFEFESRWRQVDSAYQLSSRATRAEENFAMGLTYFQPCTGGIVRPQRELHDMQAAARYFRKACELGKKEAHRFLGDIFYHGYGVDVCFRTAVSIYEEGVARNDTASKFRLAMSHEHGHGTELCTETAVLLFSEAADEGCAESMFALGNFKLHGKFMEPNHNTAFRLLSKAVKLGVGAANGYLALCYDRGIGVESDEMNSFKLLRGAFDEGSLLCITDIAHCYDTGRGVEKNPAEATKLYERVIQVGTWHSDFYKALYGLRLIQGIGTEVNVSRGKAIIVDAINSGSAIAWYALGECYRFGYGWKRNKTEAIRFYKRAITCKNGFAGLVGSYEALGQMFETGDGVVASAELSSSYYLSAANMLSSKGQWKAAKAFERGRGQPENLNRAVHLFRMCANSGHRRAQRKVLNYYMKGHGLERSRVHARKMMKEAAKAGNEEAKLWLISEDLRDATVYLRRITL